jgi:hypothetical protein
MCDSTSMTTVGREHQLLPRLRAGACGWRVDGTSAPAPERRLRRPQLQPGASGSQSATQRRPRTCETDQSTAAPTAAVVAGLAGRALGLRARGRRPITHPASALALGAGGAEQDGSHDGN